LPFDDAPNDLSLTFHHLRHRWWLPTILGEKAAISLAGKRQTNRITLAQPP